MTSIAVPAVAGGTPCHEAGDTGTCQRSTPSLPVQAGAAMAASAQLRKSCPPYTHCLRIKAEGDTAAVVLSGSTVEAALQVGYDGDVMVTRVGS